MATEKIPGGLASGKPDSAFNKQALVVGTKVEMEHTTDKEIAKEVAKDHLSEDPKYYVKLKKVEKAEDPITKWKTPSGELKKPPKEKDERKKMVSDLIRHYLKQPKEKLPGGQKQAVAIAMNQAGMSKAEPLYLDLSKGYEGFEKVKQEAADSGAKDPEAVAAAVGRKKYGKAAFQSMASQGIKAPTYKKKQSKKSLMDEMVEKAAGHKYIKRTAKPGGGYDYDYGLAPGKTRNWGHGGPDPEGVRNEPNKSEKEVQNNLVNVVAHAMSSAFQGSMTDPSKLTERQVIGAGHHILSNFALGHREPNNPNWMRTKQLVPGGERASVQEYAWLKNTPDSRHDTIIKQAWSKLANEIGLKSDLFKKSLMDEMVSKASGEGTRGGKIIGHTKSGKPIYAGSEYEGVSGRMTPSEKKQFKANHAEHSKQDHLDAFHAHADQYDKKSKEIQEHLSAADKKYGKGDNPHSTLSGGNREHWPEEVKEKTRQLHKERNATADVMAHHYDSTGKRKPQHVYRHEYASGKGKMDKSMIEEMMEKAQSGEGSRGGKIVGHTISGHPIYGKEGDKHSWSAAGFDEAHKDVSAEGHKKMAAAASSEGHTSLALAHTYAASHKQLGDEGSRKNLHKYLGSHSVSVRQSPGGDTTHHVASPEYEKKVKDLGGRHRDLLSLDSEKSLMEGMMSKAGEGSRGGKVVGHTKGGNPVYAKEGSEGKEDPKKTLEGLYRQITLHHEKISKEGDPGGYYQKTIDRLSSMASDLEKKHGLNKALTASALAIPRRPKFETIEESGSRVLTRTNSVFGNVPNTPQLLEVTPEIEKSNPISCQACGRVYMAKSSPNGCPTCEYRRRDEGQPGPRW